MSHRLTTIRGWSEPLYEFRFHPALSRPGAGWQRRTGYMQDAVGQDFADLAAHSIYPCGSPTMIRDAKRAFLVCGASVDHLYADGINFQGQG